MSKNNYNSGLDVVTERESSKKNTINAKPRYGKNSDSVQDLIPRQMYSSPSRKENIVERPHLKPMMNKRFPKPTFVNISAGKGAISIIKKDISTAKTAVSS